MKESAIWDKHWSRIDDLDKYIDVRNSEDLWTEMHYEIIDDHLKSLNEDSVFIEAGCGLGQWCFYAAEKYNIKSIGVDVAKNSIDRLNKYVNDKKPGKVSFYLDDLNNTTIKAQDCDMFVSLGVIEHFKDSNPMLKSLYKILKNDGIGLITVPNLISFHTILRPISKAFGKFDIGYEKSFSSRGLRKICKNNGFKIIDYGVLPSGTSFGLTLTRMFPFLKKVSLFLEQKTKNMGFVLYVVVSK